MIIKPKIIRGALTRLGCLTWSGKPASGGHGFGGWEMFSNRIFQKGIYNGIYRESMGL